MNNEAKILLFDIETSPNLGYVWGKYKQYVNEYDREWYMMCFAYKWLGQKKIYVKALPDYKRYKSNSFDDKELIKELWGLFDTADIIIGHNSDRFDIKKANARFLVYGLDPPSSYNTIDTLKVSRKYFKLNSNKLEDIGQYLGLGKKDKVDFDLWMGCLQGDTKSWRKMKRYNKRDVELLEKVYLKMRKWIDRHPHVGKGCPTCGSKRLRKKGFRTTKSGIKYRRFYCNDCGGWSQRRYSEPEKPDLK